MRSSQFFLVAGVCLGLLLALGAALFEGGIDLPTDNVAARVNGSVISQDEYQRAVEAVAGDKRNPITDEIRADILERLIEEELLVQRGLDIGLLESDRDVRKSIVNAMLAYVVASHSGHVPTDDEITAFYDQNKAYFAVTERVHVKRIYVSGADASFASKRLQQIRQKLGAGNPFDEVAENFTDQIIPTLPDGPLPAKKLRDYLGPTLTEAALSLDAGAISDPLRSGSGFHILYAVSVQKGAAPPLDSVRNQVVTEYKRRTDEAALRDYLNWLKSEAEIDRPSVEGGP